LFWDLNQEERGLQWRLSERGASESATSGEAEGELREPERLPSKSLIPQIFVFLTKILIRISLIEAFEKLNKGRQLVSVSHFYDLRNVTVVSFN